jgi:three-Cys-motif partner protein
MRWKCANCGFQKDERLRSCPKCGLVQAGKWTHQKYEILEEYCHPLSLIMRNQGFEHYFIDACAGSGVVQRFDISSLVDGSPLIMTKTREWVENAIKDKTKQPSLQCKFVEVESKTFKLLERYTAPYSEFVECKEGDCNKEIPSMLDKIPSAFTFVYIDPFGLGDPVVRYETVEQVLDRSLTELFIHFSWEGISRAAGQLENIDHPNDRIRRVARSTVETINSYMKGTEWQEVWKSQPAWQRRKAILELYLSGLKTHYEFIEYVEIPVGSKDPDYYLVFTTRNPTGRKIMKDIINKKRRKGATPLEKWFEGS